MVRNKQKQKIKKKLKDFNLTAPNTPTHKTSGKLLFPFVLTEEKSITVDVLVHQRLGCNLPTTGWSLPKAKIISALKYINTVTTKSLITNAVKDVSNKNSFRLFCGDCLEVMIKKQWLESVYHLGPRLFLRVGALCCQLA